MSSILEAALSYASKGWHVFPLQARGKIPFAGGAAHKDASNDPDQIRAWWAACPDANIGLSLEPSGLVVLDVDVGPGKGGFEALQELHADHPLTPSISARTGGGGMHVFYSRPPGCPAKRLIDFQSRLMPEASKGSGLDLLGLGYVVAAPSVGASGVAYTWGDTSTPLAELPQSLVQAYTAKKATVERPESGEEATVFEGGRDNALFRLGCALRDTGLTEEALNVALYSENKRRCNPPLEDHEVFRIVASVMGRVVPTRDVLNDTAFRDAVIPDAAEGLAPIKGDEGRLSLTLAQICAHKEPPKRVIATGFKSLDTLIGGGFTTRDVAALIAPPGAGKSALAVAFCLNAEIPSLYISTELSSHDVKARIASQVLGVPWVDIMRGKVDEAEIEKQITCLGIRVIGSELLPSTLPDGSAASIKDKLRAIAAEIYAYSVDSGTPPFVVFDYMQDLARTGDNAGADVGMISLLFRNIAKALDCAIVMVAATARGWYGAHPDIENPQGFMGAGKESGGIEYDAAVTLFLDVDADVSKGHQAARIVVAKSRQGMAGFVGARFDGARGGRWTEDEHALEVFTKDYKTEGRKSDQIAGDDKAVLMRIQSHGADPRGALQLNSGIPATRAKQAIYRMLESGKLEARKESRIDGFGRSKTHEVIGLPTRKQEKMPPEAPKNALSFFDGSK